MVALTACRTCLAIDDRMYWIAGTLYEETYETLTNVPLQQNNGNTVVVCYICLHFLKRCRMFIKRSVKADNLLKELITNGFQITRATLSMLNASQLRRTLEVTSTQCISLGLDKESSRVWDRINFENVQVKTECHDDYNDHLWSLDTSGQFHKDIIIQVHDPNEMRLFDYDELCNQVSDNWQHSTDKTRNRRKSFHSNRGEQFNSNNINSENESDIETEPFYGFDNREASQNIKFYEEHIENFMKALYSAEAEVHRCDNIGDSNQRQSKRNQNTSYADFEEKKLQYSNDVDKESENTRIFVESVKDVEAQKSVCSSNAYLNSLNVTGNEYHCETNEDDKCQNYSNFDEETRNLIEKEQINLQTNLSPNTTTQNSSKSSFVNQTESLRSHDYENTDDELRLDANNLIFNAKEMDQGICDNSRDITSHEHQDSSLSYAKDKDQNQQTFILAPDEFTNLCHTQTSQREIGKNVVNSDDKVLQESQDLDVFEKDFENIQNQIQQEIQESYVLEKQLGTCQINLVDELQSESQDSNMLEKELDHCQKNLGQDTDVLEKELANCQKNLVNSEDTVQQESQDSSVFEKELKNGHNNLMNSDDTAQEKISYVLEKKLEDCQISSVNTEDTIPPKSQASNIHEKESENCQKNNVNSDEIVRRESQNSNVLEQELEDCQKNLVNTEDMIRQVSQDSNVLEKELVNCPKNLVNTDDDATVRKEMLDSNVTKNEFENCLEINLENSDCNVRHKSQDNILEKESENCQKNNVNSDEMIRRESQNSTVLEKELEGYQRNLVNAEDMNQQEIRDSYVVENELVNYPKNLVNTDATVGKEMLDFNVTEKEFANCLEINVENSDYNVRQDSREPNVIVKELENGQALFNLDETAINRNNSLSLVKSQNAHSQGTESDKSQSSSYTDNAVPNENLNSLEKLVVKLNGFFQTNSLAPHKRQHSPDYHENDVVRRKNIKKSERYQNSLPEEVLTNRPYSDNNKCEGTKNSAVFEEECSQSIFRTNTLFGEKSQNCSYFGEIPKQSRSLSDSDDILLNEEGRYFYHKPKSTECEKLLNNDTGVFDEQPNCTSCENKTEVRHNYISLNDESGSKEFENSFIFHHKEQDRSEHFHSDVEKQNEPETVVDKTLKQSQNLSISDKVFQNEPLTLISILQNGEVYRENFGARLNNVELNVNAQNSNDAFSKEHDNDKVLTNQVKHCSKKSNEVIPGIPPSINTCKDNVGKQNSLNCDNIRPEQTQNSDFHQIDSEQRPNITHFGCEVLNSTQHTFDQEFNKPENNSNENDLPVNKYNNQYHYNCRDVELREQETVSNTNDLEQEKNNTNKIGNDSESCINVIIPEDNHILDHSNSYEEDLGNSPSILDSFDEQFEENCNISSPNERFEDYQNSSNLDVGHDEHISASRHDKDPIISRSISNSDDLRSVKRFDASSPKENKVEENISIPDITPEPDSCFSPDIDSVESKCVLYYSDDGESNEPVDYTYSNLVRLSQNSVNEEVSQSESHNKRTHNKQREDYTEAIGSVSQNFTPHVKKQAQYNQNAENLTFNKPIDHSHLNLTELESFVKINNNDIRTTESHNEREMEDWRITNECNLSEACNKELDRPNDVIDPNYLSSKERLDYSYSSGIEPEDNTSIMDSDHTNGHQNTRANKTQVEECRVAFNESRSSEINDSSPDLKTVIEEEPSILINCDTISKAPSSSSFVNVNSIETQGLKDEVVPTIRQNPKSHRRKRKRPKKSPKRLTSRELLNHAFEDTANSISQNLDLRVSENDSSSKIAKLKNSEVKNKIKTYMGQRQKVKKPGNIIDTETDVLESAYKTDSTAIKNMECTENLAPELSNNEPLSLIDLEFNVTEAGSEIKMLCKNVNNAENNTYIVSKCANSPVAEIKDSSTKTKNRNPLYFQCSHCNKQFNNKSRLLNHLRTHDKQLYCEICDKTFSTTGLNKHIKDLHDGDYLCERCGEKFAGKKVLTDHLTSHYDFGQKRYIAKHKSGPGSYPREKLFTCHSCGKAFFTKAGLSVHRTTMHTIGYPYKCKLCNMAFERKSHLKTHSRVHKTKVMEYICDICSKGFKLKTLISQHIKNVHSKSKRKICSKFKKMLINAKSNHHSSC